MSFHTSFNNLHINTRPGHTVLEGTTHDERGLDIDSQILLDDYIGNSNGMVSPCFPCVHLQSEGF